MSTEEQDRGDLHLEVDDVGTSSSSEDEQPACDHPWPHLKQYFRVKCVEGNHAVFTCVQCQPKKVEVKGHATSLSNLKSHIKRKHSLKN